MKAWLVAFLIVLFAFFITLAHVEARSGCCSWHGGVSHCDTSVGTYICNDGTYSPSCGCTYIPPKVILPDPTPIIIPETVKGGPIYKIDKKTNAYDVEFNWDDVPETDGYSIALYKIAGGDPGPLVDTYASTWTFQDITPGKWYVNLKANINGYWSRVAYWDIQVPELPQPTRTRSSITPTIRVVSVGGDVKKIPSPTKSPTPTKTKYSCNCSRTCTQMWSCEEAYYQLNNCGCSQRDGDSDGVPCENLCR